MSDEVPRYEITHDDVTVEAVVVRSGESLEISGDIRIFASDFASSGNGGQR